MTVSKVSDLDRTAVWDGSTLPLDVPYPIEFDTDGDLECVFVDGDGIVTLAALTTNYTVTGAGDPSGGTVSFTTIPAGTASVGVVRNTLMDQVVDLSNTERNDAPAVEEQLDKLTRGAQDRRNFQSRSVRLPLGTVASVPRYLPIGIENKALIGTADGGFDPNGPTTTDIANAQSNATAAALSASNAATSAASAATSATSSAIDATAAATSATNAATSETNAGTSATAAATSATNAAISETNAGNSATSAATSETNAATSATAASTSATAAATSATNAATSETNAGTSATAASASATAAATSAATFVQDVFGTTTELGLYDFGGNPPDVIYVGRDRWVKSATAPTNTNHRAQSADSVWWDGRDRIHRPLIYTNDYDIDAFSGNSDVGGWNALIAELTENATVITPRGTMLIDSALDPITVGGIVLRGATHPRECLIQYAADDVFTFNAAPQLVPNWNFDTANLDDWTNNGGGSASVSGGEFTASSIVVQYYIDVTVEVGKTYKYSHDVTSGSGVSAFLYNNATPGFTGNIASGVASHTFTATETNLRIYLYSSTATVSTTIDNVALVSTDYSYWNAVENIGFQQSTATTDKIFKLGNTSHMEFNNLWLNSNVGCLAEMGGEGTRTVYPRFDNINGAVANVAVPLFKLRDGVNFHLKNSEVAAAVDVYFPNGQPGADAAVLGRYLVDCTTKGPDLWDTITVRDNDTYAWDIAVNINVTQGSGNETAAVGPIEVDHNIFDSNRTGSIKVDVDTNTYLKEGNFSNNYVSSRQGKSIHMTGAGDLRYTFINDNRSRINGTDGIYVDVTGEVVGCSIDRNLISDANFTEVASGTHGIYVNGDAQYEDLSVSHNKTGVKDYDDKDGSPAPHPTEYGISVLGAIAGLTMIGNHAHGESAAKNYQLTTTATDGKIRDNVGLDPVVDTVTLGASPATHTCGSRPETIDCSGGTVSAVSYAGQANWFTATGFKIRLEPGEPLIFTYSSVPTITRIRH